MSSFLPIRHLRHPSHSFMFLSLGVPQLSLGQKATLTITPDFASISYYEKYRRVSDGHNHRDTELGVILLSSPPTPRSSLRLSYSRSTEAESPFSELGLAHLYRWLIQLY